MALNIGFNPSQDYGGMGDWAGPGGGAPHGFAIGGPNYGYNPSVIAANAPPTNTGNPMGSPFSLGGPFGMPQLINQGPIDYTGRPVGPFENTVADPRTAQWQGWGGLESNFPPVGATTQPTGWWDNAWNKFSGAMNNASPSNMANTGYRGGMDVTNYGNDR